MKIILINGPMGVGKTTIGKYIAEKNIGTAFIDGDWCLDIHPFIGNRETKTMAIDNILHMIDNYRKCSACKMIVFVWLMDNQWVYQRIIEGIETLQLVVKSVTLICDKASLINRWTNDKNCEWRTEEWLEDSIKSLQYFETLENQIDTSNMNIEDVANKIMFEQ